METNELEPQVVAHTEEQPTATETLSPEEIAELKAKAAVSSQNFERLKKVEAEKKELEAKVQLLETTDPFATDDSVQKQVADLAAKLQKIEDDKQMNSVIESYPILKDKQSEFDTFRQDYPGMNLQNVAKVFLAEHDLLGGTKRKGLEKAGGGQRVAPESGKVSAADMERLRKTNHKEYLRVIRSGVQIG